MKVAILYEFSGRVRRAFRARGHQAWSYDLLPAEDGERDFHVQADIDPLLRSCHDHRGWPDDFDVVIAFPPCTYLAVSGARWFAERQDQQKEAVRRVAWLLALPCGKIALENPIGVISTRIRKPDQIIQPWMFGHGETKATCLWLKNLPLLKPTDIVDGRYGRVWREAPSPERWKNRSRTYQGIADAMAAQWG